MWSQDNPRLSPLLHGDLRSWGRAGAPHISKAGFLTWGPCIGFRAQETGSCLQNNVCAHRQLLGESHGFPSELVWCTTGSSSAGVPTSWFKMAARALAAHLSSRREAEHLSSRKEAEQCDGEGRAKKAPLQFSVPLLMSPEIHFHLPVHTHPQDRLEGNTVSRLSVLQRHIKCVSINKKKERMTDNQEFLLQSLSHRRPRISDSREDMLHLSAISMPTAHAKLTEGKGRASKCLLCLGNPSATPEFTLGLQRLVLPSEVGRCSL